MRFVIYRWGYRYVVWSILLWRIGHLKLHLMPTHPDHAAGLNFLSVGQRRFGILFCALGCSFAGRVANAMIFEGVSLASYEALMVGFVVLSVLVGLLPLTLLAPRLAKVRRAGCLSTGSSPTNIPNRSTRSGCTFGSHRQSHYWEAATFSRWRTLVIAMPTSVTWTSRQLPGN
jgi:hypothetical protein